MAGGAPTKIGILVVAYRGASRLASVLDRIPPDFRSKVSHVVVSDDRSHASTHRQGLGQGQTSDLSVTLIRHAGTLGYGGNQKVGYRFAIEHGLDIVVLLHGDGQYAPESLPEIVAPLERGECDAVFGSRMMTKGAARRGGMPLYKYAGNRVLSIFEKVALGTDLTEFHSGYRAYSVEALGDIPFEKTSDGFNFDTQIIIQMRDAGMRLAEVPIPTYFGDEIGHVNGMRYAWEVTKDVLAYRLQKAGFGDGERFALSEEYQLKQSPDSSHGRIFALLASRPPSRILDLGCSSGLLAQRLHDIGHDVTGVDMVETPGVRGRMARFMTADLDAGIPAEAGTDFDVVLAADVLEHLREPQRLVREAKRILRPGGLMVVCVPNIGHWYPRFRTLLGRFDYDQRGPLDRGHLRFFTRRSITRLLEREGFRIERLEPVGLPLDALGVESRRGRLLRFLDSVVLSAWPTMFGYQFILAVEPIDATADGDSGGHHSERREERHHRENGDHPLRPLAHD